MQKESAEIKNSNSNRRVMPGRSLDLAVAGLGLLAFVTMMFLLSRWLFPVGVTLKVAGEDDPVATQRSRSGHQVSYAGQTTADNKTVAQLVTIRRNVQIKSHDALAWSTAQQGVDLFDHDSLQTLSHSGATVRLEDSSLLKVGPNSLIVLQSGVSDPFTPKRTHSLVMMEGTLGGYFASDDGNPRHLEVALPNGVARFIPGDSDAAVAFNINVNPDLSSSVSVHSGSAVITVGGQTVSVDQDEGVTININGEVIERGQLPAQPRRLQPQNRAVYQYRDIPPPLVFSWAEVEKKSTYRLTLARDAEMNDIVIDERFTASKFRYEGLQDGVYYWQVKALNGFIEGPPAGPKRLSLIRDEQPPSLELLESEYRDGQLVVRGRTDPGTRVSIQGVAIAAANGSFERVIDIEPGATLIVVEAIDGAGNVAYESKIVHSKFSLNGGGR